SVAHQLRATVRAGTHMLSVELRSVGGAYQTLGHSALQRDRRGVRARDSFSLLDHALVVSAGVEADRDNLDDTKASTTTSTGGFAVLTWQGTPDGLMLSGSVRLGARHSDAAAPGPGVVDESNHLVATSASIPFAAAGSLRTRLTI